MSTAGEFCSRRVVIARSGETLLDAAKRMLNEHVGCLVVVDENRGKLIPVGIVTDRDIVVGVLARTDRHLNSITVGDAMKSPIVTVGESESLECALKRMRSFGIRRIPVVENDGSLQGIVTFDDLLELLQEQVTDLASLLGREQKQEIATRSRTA